MCVRVQDGIIVSTVNQLITEALLMKTDVSPLKPDETRFISSRKEDRKRMINND